MNQGGTTDTLTTLDTNSLEKYPVVDPSQPHASSYYAPSSSAPISWTTQGLSNYPRENGTFSSSTCHHDQPAELTSYHHDQPAELTSRSIQDGLNVTPVASTSTSGAVNVPQDYSNYSTYQSTDPYLYGNTGYAAYYSGYQQQTSQPYQPSVGAYQNSGAPYQPLSSVQNTGSYAGSASYSNTYYNPADYQTSGGYQSGSNQGNYWQGGQYATYSSQHPNYTPDSTALYSSSTSAASAQYAQHYKQWADYYNQTQTEVSCAPGTENVSVSSASSLSCPVPGGYSASNSQAPPPYISPWRPESTSSELPAAQSGMANGGVHDGYWKPAPAPAVLPNQNLNPAQLVQTPLETSATYESFQNQQKSTHPQGHNSVYTAYHQVPQSYQSSLPTVSQTALQLDSRRVSNKLQIPTNPRIASNLGLGLSKVDKDISPSIAPSKPAYISVSLSKPNEKVPSEDAAAESILKPGMFPKSLCGYVERALARCKGDKQMAASQAIMKEIITKATADGTLHTRDWDTEPLFTLPNADSANQEDVLFSTPISSLPKSRKSPSRRSKSRWEPISEEKVPDKPVDAVREPVKYGFWNKQHFSGGKIENKVDNWGNTKFSLPEQKSSNKNSIRPAKKQRLVDGLDAADNGETSSESDKEQTLTAYYSAAVALADSPEERKRRESRSKRFEKGHGNRAEHNHFRQKNVGAGNLHTRRATALVLCRNFEDSGTKAVEDIDWDALTVKGTCQEIEKRYLRLTSAPDPATVRPEEVLEKALLMVQNSEKNYLYKCDQLKSIRQDLTVQHIHNELTVKVYETHARLAIEAGDLPEYNQCQSQLKTLYAEGIRGCHLEFAAYNLLCVILHSNNNRDLLSAMSRLSAEARKNDAVKHALAVRAAVISGNYVLFFRLYKTAPNLNPFLMDLYVEKMRYAAVKCMSRSYRPTIPVAYISQVLGFSSVLPTTEVSDEKERDGVEECAEWLKAHGACLTNDNSREVLLDTKVSMSNLYMPEPEDAVSHGDANLAVIDFLARNPV